MVTKSTKRGKATAVRKPAAKSTALTKVSELPDEQAQQTQLAQLAVRPSVNAAMVITEYAKPLGELSVMALTETLVDGMDKLAAGDLSRCEGMLYGQAQALQSIFVNFSRRALNQQYQKHLESFLRMALKAQNQCRMTLETLAAIKNPPVVFARQANIAHGPQQVNNGVSEAIRADTRAPAANLATEQTELLEANDGQRLDTGAAGAAGGADPHLETVATVHRPAHR